MENVVKANNIAESTRMYKHVLVRESTLECNVSVGDFSHVKQSSLRKNVRIDRYNHIDGCTVGRFSYTGRNVILLHSTIGAFCSLSWNVTVGGANHDYSRITQHSFLYDANSFIRPDMQDIAYSRYSGCVSLGNDVWLGAGVVVARGVKIGDGAVVGANSVVTKDVPPYAVVVGAPARIIKYRFEKNTVELLLRLKWWDWPIDKIKLHYNILSASPCNKKLEELLIL